MAASKTATVMAALKTCLEGVTAANGYDVTVQEVRRGIHLDDDMPNRPALGFTNTRGERSEFAQGRSGRTLIVVIYGYVDVEPGDYEDLDSLMQAVEQRLMTPAAWSYYGFTDIKNYTVYEGGQHDKIGYFDMEVEIFYEHEWASP